MKPRTSISLLRLKCFQSSIPLHLVLSGVGAWVISVTAIDTTAIASWKDDIGFTQLSAELGLAIPSGDGIAVTLVEANTGNAASTGQQYMPDVSNPEFHGKTISDQSGTSTTVSGHADRVAELSFGLTKSIAPGVTNIGVYEATDYVNNVLHSLSGNDPEPPATSVQNHSWVSGATELTVTNILERFDYTIDQYDVTATVGLGNGPGNVPQVLAHSYNAIAVGRSDGDHTFGLTGLSSYGLGRVKPDIVAPQSTTSTSSAIVSSAVAMLFQAAQGTNATRVEPMKAILLAGATKDNLNSWSQTQQQPLDEVYGAGQLNVYNSFHILEAGEQQASVSEPTTAVSENGWDYVPLTDASSPLYYNIHVPTDGGTLSAVLAWNLAVTDENIGPRFNGARNLADLDLRLFDSDETFLESVIDVSSSEVANVEHIYRRGLPAGVYTLEVTSDGAQDFGIAWHLEVVPEPSSRVLGILALAFLLVRWRSRFFTDR